MESKAGVRTLLDSQVMRNSAPISEEDHAERSSLQESLIIQKKQIEPFWPYNQKAKGNQTQANLPGPRRFGAANWRRKSQNLSPENRIRITRNRNLPIQLPQAMLMAQQNLTYFAVIQKKNQQLNQRPTAKNRWDVGVNMRGIGTALPSARGGLQLNRGNNQTKLDLV